jgi:hypothetical protein
MSLCVFEREREREREREKEEVRRQGRRGRGADDILIGCESSHIH